MKDNINKELIQLFDELLKKIKGNSLTTTKKISIESIYDEVFKEEEEEKVNEYIELFLDYLINKGYELDYTSNTNYKDEEFNIEGADDIKLYLSEIGAIEIFTPEEEKYYFELYKKNPSNELKKFIAEHNLKLVVPIAKRSLNKGLSFLDLIQEGNIGLMEAIDKFKVDMGNKFSTYAHWWIYSSIRRAIHNKSRTIRVPIHMGEEIVKLNKIKSELSSELNRYPTQEELCEYLEIDIEELRKIERYEQECVSLDIKVGDKGDYTIKDLIEDDSESFEKEIETKYFIQQLFEIVNCNDVLTEREYQVLLYRFGFIDGKVKTLEEVGEIFKVSRERIRQIEAKALEKLNNMFLSEDRSIKEYEMKSKFLKDEKINKRKR